MGLRQRKKQQVRETILEVCGRLFRSRGFDESSVDHIVSEVGISRQTFFNYFPGKDAVLAELGLRWLREQAEPPRRGARSGRGQSLFEGLRRATRVQLQAIERDPDFMRLVFTRSGLFFPQGAHVGSESDAPRLDRTRELLDAVAAAIRAGQEAGVVRRDIDARQAAEMYVSVLVITIRLWLTNYWNEEESLVKRGMRALTVLEDGLRVRGATK